MQSSVSRNTNRGGDTKRKRRTSTPKTSRNVAPALQSQREGRAECVGAENPPVDCSTQIMHIDTLHGIDKILGNIEREIEELTRCDSKQVHTADLDTKDNISEFITKIVSNTPFVKMLEGMPTTTRHTEIPIITRRYEEQYMREPQSIGEKNCFMQDKCECMFIDPNKPFVGVRFVMPVTYNSTCKVCILCLRKQTQSLYYKTVFAGYNPQVVIQQHGNICNEESEYDKSAVLTCNPNGPIHCMPLPIVAHQRNRYSVHEISGVKHLKQHGVYFQGFGMPPA